MVLVNEMSLEHVNILHSAQKTWTIIDIEEVVWAGLRGGKGGLRQRNVMNVLGPAKIRLGRCIQSCVV